MADKRVALVLSGGVSLGAYIAGALDELLRAFDASHAQAGGDRYTIDVITGASAGATTAAMVAHGLLFSNGATRLEPIWVEQIDAAELLAPHVTEPATLLSGAPLQAIAADVFRLPHDQAAAPARCCADQVYVAMTLANLQAVPYRSRRPMQTADSEQPFIQYRHTEQETFVFTRDAAMNPQAWERVAQVAVASAAIPFAFPPIRLRRNLGDGLHYIQDPGVSGPVYEAHDPEREFWYCDGGTFNNLPLDLAWHYTRQIDTARTGTNDPEVLAEDRLFVMIDPSPDVPLEVAARRPPTIAPPGVLDLIGYMITAHRAESSAIQFDHEVLQRSRSSISARIGKQPPASELPSIPGVDQPAVEILDRVALVLPDVARPLAGAHLLMSLSGFLDQRFRAYDYRRGAADARRTARDLLGIVYDSGMPEAFYHPDDDPQVRVDLPSYAALANYPSSRTPGKTVQAVFENHLEARLRSLLTAGIDALDPPGPNQIVDWPLQAVLSFTFNAVRQRVAALW